MSAEECFSKLREIQTTGYINVKIENFNNGKVYSVTVGQNFFTSFESFDNALTKFKSYHKATNLLR